MSKEDCLREATGSMFTWTGNSDGHGPWLSEGATKSPSGFGWVVLSLGFLVALSVYSLCSAIRILQFKARLVRETKGVELEDMDDGSGLRGGADPAPATG